MDKRERDPGEYHFFVDKTPVQSYEVRYEIAIDRYEEAMGLLERALYIANDFSTVNATAHNIVLELIRKKNELRDSE